MLSGKSRDASECVFKNSYAMGTMDQDDMCPNQFLSKDALEI
jgi:hypothetical protein